SPPAATRPGYRSATSAARCPTRAPRRSRGSAAGRWPRATRCSTRSTRGRRRRWTARCATSPTAKRERPRVRVLSRPVTLVPGDPLAHRALESLLRAEANVRRRLSADLEREGLSATAFSVLVVLTTAGGELELRDL